MVADFKLGSDCQAADTACSPEIAARANGSVVAIGTKCSPKQLKSAGAATRPAVGEAGAPGTHATSVNRINSRARFIGYPTLYLIRSRPRRSSNRVLEALGS